MKPSTPAPLVDVRHETDCVLVWKPSRLTRSVAAPAAVPVSSNFPSASVSFVVPASGPSRTATSAPGSGRRTVSLTEPRIWVCPAGGRGKVRPGFTSGAIGEGGAISTPKGECDEHAAARDNGAPHEHVACFRHMPSRRNQLTVPRPLTPALTRTNRCVRRPTE